ncbi:hypothetical protein GTO10_07025 [Candidatus Saccharibacteria bacterium]|nr:hypothetical protein [Candidatus Saccharibacteria bacterium]
MPDFLFNIGPLPVYAFGVLLAISYLLGVFIFWRLGRREGFPSEGLFDIALSTSIVAVIGARLLFLKFFGGYINFLDIFRMGEGVSWVGALIFGFFAFAVFVRVKKWSFFRIADLVVLGMAFGQAGGFLASEAARYIPFSIYLALGYLLLGFVLKFLHSRAAPGVAFFAYLIVSGAFLAFLEYLRVDKAVWMGQNINYSFGAFLSTVGLVGLIAKTANLRFNRGGNGR